MVPIIGSETLHSEPADVFRTTKADWRPMTESSDHATDEMEERGFTSGIERPTIAVRKAGEKSSIDLVTGLPLPIDTITIIFQALLLSMMERSHQATTLNTR